MKPHYFTQEKADDDDTMLKMCIQQGYVPSSCLLNGQLVYALINKGQKPCFGCQGPRNKCKGT